MKAEEDALADLAAAQREQIDAVFFTIDVEGEAQARREELIDRRMAAEERLARWQVRNAKTEEQREKARTKLDEVEQAKRVRALERAAAGEAKTLAKRQETIEKVTGHVLGVGQVLVDGLERAVEGEKGALAEGLEVYLKDIRNRMILKALEQTALAAAAVASYNYPKAAMHGTAAGLATAAAVAAGIGGAAAGAVADARRGPSSGGGSGGGGNSGGGGEESGVRVHKDERELERQEVPVSYEQGRRDNAMPRERPPTQLVLHVHGNVIGEGGKRELGQYLRKAIAEGGSAGKRY
jgi:hypothetical protein